VLRLLVWEHRVLEVHLLALVRLARVLRLLA
jgi:hypothetical protein